jgi:hypothetical protein
MSDTEANSDDKPTPPVPPGDHRRIPELDEGSTVRERERVMACPDDRCPGSIWLFVVDTGEAVMAFWDREQFDAEQYQLSITYEWTARYQECDHCGWRVEL